MPETLTDLYICLTTNPPAPVEKDPVEDYTRVHCRNFGVPASVISNGLRAKKPWHDIVEAYQKKNIWTPVEYLKDKWVGILPVWSPEAIEKFPDLFSPYLLPGPNKDIKVLTSWLMDNHGERLLNKLMGDEEDEDSEEDEEFEYEFESESEGEENEDTEEEE